MPVKQLEKNLSYTLSAIRKTYYGKGSIDTQVRICGDTIFVKYKSPFSPLEKTLINANIVVATEVFTGWEELVKQDVKKGLTSLLGTGVEVLGVYIRAVTEHDISYHCILLDRNIEKLVKSRKDVPNADGESVLF
ncbi:Na-translocating system protein MpsC family protein [Paenibacillus sp. NPDC057967]|uniref:Na-translocating system protein MpsC family protein n=1 Tax=Paenibacillus sp. NPDC057967 TaxID=3346293 RepID=UPI0036DDC17D